MRISVSGTSGAGKTTFATTLVEALGCPHIDLDAINWQADWYDLNTHEPEEFRRRVSEATSADVWVASGNYSAVRPAILARVTHMIWLDYSKAVVMSRVIRRSFHRAWTGSELWPGTGNRETFKRWLDPEHPIRWAWDTYDRRRARAEDELNDPGLSHVERIRLNDPRDARPLIDRLARLELPLLAVER